MRMNQTEIERAASRYFACPNVRKGVKLLFRLMQSVNAQSDGWAYWRAPADSAKKLEETLKLSGNIVYGSNGTITDEQLKMAIMPIRRMVNRQKKLQAEHGNTFDFDVNEALKS